MPKLTGFPRVSLPGLRPVPLLGHLPRVLQFMIDPIAVMARLRPLGDVAAVSRDCPALVCAFGPERNREVLSNPDGFRNAEDFLDGPEGTSMARMKNGLMSLNGEVHKRHRRLIAPAFSKSALEGYAAPIVELGERAIERWPRGEVADIDALLHDLALEIAMRTLFGVGAGEGPNDLGMLATRWVAVLNNPLALMRVDFPGSPFRRALRMGDAMLDGLERLVAEKRRHTGQETDALALLLRATEDDDSGFSDDELMPEVVTLFFGGHETTAKTLTWTMFLLDQHPDVLADLLDELDGVLGGRSVTAADIPRMPLLDRVIKESMRILTSVPTLFLRVPHEETPLGRFTMPAGSNVVISPHATHHDPALYAEPRRFLPRRWEGLRPSAYEYMPFGAGARACIGAAFAQQMLRLVVPTILQRVRMSVVRDARVQRIVRGNIHRPRYGIPARIEAAHRRRVRPEPVRGNIHEVVALG